MSDIFIKGPVLIPGVTGRPGMEQDRPLTAEEIQKAAYQFLPGYAIVDVQHSFKKQAEVVESFIAPEETEFNGKMLPAGTWFMTSKVTDPIIAKAVTDGELKGYSAGALPEKQYKELKRDLPVLKGMFSDVNPGEWFAFTVSIVDEPWYPEMLFKIFDESDFIKKSLDPKSEVNNMENENVIGKVLDYFIGKETAAAEPEPVATPEFVTKEDLASFKTELMDEIKEAVKPVEAETETEETEENISEETTEASTEQTEQTEETGASTETESTEAITKSLPTDQPPVKKESFMKKLGRDANGCKIIE